MESVGFMADGADGQDVRFDRALFQNILIRSYDSITGMAEMLGTHGDIYQPIWIIALVRIFNGVAYLVSTFTSWPSPVAIL